MGIQIKVNIGKEKYCFLKKDDKKKLKEFNLKSNELK